MSTQLSDVLSSLDMSINSGLVFTDSTNDPFNYTELLALDQAKKFGAKAVYFRRVQDSSKGPDEIRYNSLPQVYIYDEELDDSALVDIHRNLWSSGVVPFFYVITKSQIKVFSCTRKAEQTEDGLIVNPFKEFSVASEIIDDYNQQKFSAKLFDNGTIWQQDEFIDLLDPKNGPYETLMEGLLAAKENLNSQARKHNISENTISKLLIMCILVKYLEEKIDENGVKLFAIHRDFLNKFDSSPTSFDKFTDVLRNGYTVEFFESLSEKFSGNVFKFTEIEKKELEETDLYSVANVFDAKMAGNGQYVLWDLYSFNYLPIELISGIYEAFLNHGTKNKSSKGVVYTPPYLVNFLIDECMPLDKAEDFFSQEEFKVLDPACGSGIFLVSAFKRMVQWKAILNYRSTGVILYPELETVRRIIRNNIFGVDIEHDATRLTIFSLCIAICEKLSPMQIWHSLQFDDLSQINIRTNNFFAYFNDIDGLQRESFDLVIGNPPFNPPPGINNLKYYEQLVLSYPVKPSAPIHDNNLAIHFLDRCMRFPKRGRSTCLILPSGAWLYNNNSQAYRKHFAETHTLNKIIDFTHLSDVLFYRRANVAVCAVIAQNASPILKPSVLHLVVHRAKVAESRYYFEVDHYDFNNVRYHTALNNPHVWKANLLGGGRLLRLIERLNRLDTVNDFLKLKKKEFNWEFGEGYVISHKGQYSEEELLSKDFVKAPWITNHPSLITESLGEDGIFEIEVEKNVYFYRVAVRNKAIFSPPHVLIRETLGKNDIPIAFSEDYICFKHQIIGVYAPASQVEDLKKFYNRFKKYNSLYRFYMTSISGRAGVSLSSSTLLKRDLMDLPYTEDEEDMALSLLEEVVKSDVSKYLIRLGQNTSSSPLFSQVSDVELNAFGEVFCKAINPIYENIDFCWQVDSYVKKDNIIGYAFRYGRNRSEQVVNWIEGEDNEVNIYNLIENKTQRNVRTTRVLRAYLHVDGYDILILTKPNMLRYWLKSIALRDSDETFADLKRAGF